MQNQVVDISDKLQEVARGNETAFRDLFLQYADHLYAYIWQLTKSRELAEEVVQDIFLQIWISREALAEVRNFRNYLFVIARNHALNAMKKMMRERKRAMEWELARGKKIRPRPASPTSTSWKKPSGSCPPSSRKPGS
ncbi:sigma factor [Chitinophaga pollutisoli]|uniref:Sigma factor n=1 Tax=Chitinophaga pollutisoli TaxID=3133966 RepID=A0ABZ2YML3_9BACT